MTGSSQKLRWNVSRPQVEGVSPHVSVSASQKSYAHDVPVAPPASSNSDAYPSTIVDPRDVGVGKLVGDRPQIARAIADASAWVK